MELGPEVVVVIPAHNEASAIGDVLDEVVECHPRVRIVVVDDGSTDATSEVAEQRKVDVLRHIVNLGQGAALKTGIERALAVGAEIVVTFDADGQMVPVEIPAVVEPIALGECDVVFGTRFGATQPEGLSLARRLLLKGGLAYTRAVTRLPVTDAHNGFRAFGRKALETMSLTQERMAHASEIVHEVARRGLSWTEVPVHIRYTDYSRSKGQSFLGAFDILLDLITGKR